MEIHLYMKHWFINILI